MTDYFRTYNKTLKELIDLISNEMPKDPLIETIKRGYTAMVATDRTILLTESGPEIFAFRDYISEGRWDELINRPWEKEEIKSMSDTDQQTVCKLIPLLRKVWAEYDADEKKYVQRLIKTLLSEYVKYKMNET